MNSPRSGGHEQGMRMPLSPVQLLERYVRAERLRSEYEWKLTPSRWG